MNWDHIKDDIWNKLKENPKLALFGVIGIIVIGSMLPQGLLILGGWVLGVGATIGLIVIFVKRHREVEAE